VDVQAVGCDGDWDGRIWHQCGGSRATGRREEQDIAAVVCEAVPFLCDRAAVLSCIFAAPSSGFRACPKIRPLFFGLHHQLEQVFCPKVSFMTGFFLQIQRALLIIWNDYNRSKSVYEKDKL
jgi:hypothetical protein